MENHVQHHHSEDRKVNFIIGFIIIAVIATVTFLTLTGKLHLNA